MKKIALLILAFCLITTSGIYAQKTKDSQKTLDSLKEAGFIPPHFNVDSALKTMSRVTVYLQCPNIKGQLPKFAIFQADPIEIFKKYQINTSNASLDSIAKIWDHIISYNFSPNESKLYTMLPKGCGLSGQIVGKRWIATMAIIKDKEIYMWSEPVDYEIGTEKHVVFDDKNRVKL